MNDRIRVLIIDDSPLVRETVKEMLQSDPDIEVVGLAKDGIEGVEKTLALKPNVITMDLKMPLMGGLEAIEKIMEDQPTPIIVVSSMDIKVIVTALGFGAMDFVPITDNVDEIAKDLIFKIKVASRIKPIRRIHIKKIFSMPTLKMGRDSAKKVIAIGVSTGGPQALQMVFAKLPKSLPLAILVVQHIAKGFINGLAEWLSGTSHMDIQVAKAGDALKPGMIFLAPDDYNIGVDANGIISLSEDLSRSYTHVPSIDYMMKSVAATYGDEAIGIIMTGMGQDGVEGVKAIKRGGGTTIAQDQATSVIFGMNKLAIDSGCIDRIVRLENIADEIISIAKG